jgi:hypothetical protein
VVLQRLGDAVVAVQLQSDRVLELNPTAARLLDLLAEGLTPTEAVRRMAAEYDVDDATLLDDASSTLARLQDEGVIARDEG